MERYDRTCRELTAGELSGNMATMAFSLCDVSESVGT